MQDEMSLELMWWPIVIFHEIERIMMHGTNYVVNIMCDIIKCEDMWMWWDAVMNAMWQYKKRIILLQSSNISSSFQHIQCTLKT